ncbi:hypothetical protein ACLOJK_015032 [Asimina triloba]
MVYFQRRKRATFALAFGLIFVFFAVHFPINPTHPFSPNPTAYKSLFYYLLPRLTSSTCSSPSLNESQQIPPPNHTETEAHANQTPLKSVLSRPVEDPSQNQTRPSNETALNPNGDPSHETQKQATTVDNAPASETQMGLGVPGSHESSAQNQTAQVKDDGLRSDGVQEHTQAQETVEFPKGKGAAPSKSRRKKKKRGTKKKRRWTKLVEALKGCNVFDGRWVRDDSYPLYPHGSCPLIDEPFDCFLNGRVEQGYERWRWKPNGCLLPRLNPVDMLERLRGKRLAFVGDSLNRNMWESLVCILRNSLQNKSKVFESSGQSEFRSGEGSYSFVFEDYKCSVEFFRSNFLVQEWDVAAGNGTKKETLRLDLMEQSSSAYKDADVIVFNTAHWWTHEKTWAGKDYYQEGSHVHPALDVVEAFRRALTTWGRWVDGNVDSAKSLVFFRGYSSSHFSGGQWNSGGACDGETEPIRNEAFLEPYPEMMSVLEEVMAGLATRVVYLNITVMTDFRKDAHPSMYQKPNLTEEERRNPERYQDCSHWCLPGVPDLWNELLYAQLLMHDSK